MEQEHAARFDTVTNGTRTLMVPYPRLDVALAILNHSLSNYHHIWSAWRTAGVCDVWVHYRRRAGRGIDSWYALIIPPVCGQARDETLE